MIGWSCDFYEIIIYLEYLKCLFYVLFIMLCGIFVILFDCGMGVILSYFKFVWKRSEYVYVWFICCIILLSNNGVVIDCYLLKYFIYGYVIKWVLVVKVCE